MRIAQRLLIGLAAAGLACAGCSDKKPAEVAPVGVNMPPVDPTAEPVDPSPPPPPADRT